MEVDSFSTYSEDELRTKVVYQWLKGCGFSEQQLKIEFTIKLRIGRTLKSINSRSDVLVKSVDGNNLLIIEVKKPSHILTEDDVLQGVSYACCLAEGGIAPFTIITNGSDTRIYDSITKQQITETSIPVDHLYTRNGFRVTGEALKSRSEALEYLITLSSTNLQIFCEAQVNYHMKLLSSDDLFSGKKYIPSLYLDRKHASQELKNKLFPDDNSKAANLVLIIGPPQHGKTCFVCHTVKKFISQEYPCLFYPAISLRDGLLKEIQRDFQWTFNEHMEPYHIAQRLNNLASKSGKKLYIFIDGWNELIENAFALNDECNRLEENNICIILSTTSSSLKRLVTDTADNLSFIAEKTNLTGAIIQKLSVEPLHDPQKYGIVQIDKFEHDEVGMAISIYSKEYDTIIQRPPDVLFQDPFYLRLAAEQHTGSSVPAIVTQAELVCNSLIKKGARQGIDKITLFQKLKDLAFIFFQKNRPLDILELPIEFNSEEALQPWLDSAILSCFANTNPPKIDFYYTHDLNYSIGILCRKWNYLFINASQEEIKTELNVSTQTDAGRNALSWFLSCNEFYETLRLIVESIEFNKFEKHLQKIISNSIFNQVFGNNTKEILWLEPHLEKLIASDSTEIEYKEELPQLVSSFLSGIDICHDSARFNRWLKFLISIDYTIDEVGVTESFTYNLLNETWGELELTIDEEDSLLQDEIFLDVIYNGSEIAAKRASLFIVEFKPETFLGYIMGIRRDYIEHSKDIIPVIEDACWRIIGHLNDNYYSSMCPGWLDNVEIGDEMIVAEYYKQQKELRSLTYVFPSDHGIIQEMTTILNDLYRIANIDDKPNENDLYNPNQQKFDF